MAQCITAAAETRAQGNRIALDDDGSFILNKRTGETTPIHKKNDAYVIRVRVLRPDMVAASGPKLLAPVDGAESSGGSPVFTRPALP